MSKHKAIPKATREAVYRKYNGHCAYCGCELEYKDMQVDHAKSVYKHKQGSRLSSGADREKIPGVSVFGCKSLRQ